MSETTNQMREGKLGGLDMYTVKQIIYITLKIKQFNFPSQTSQTNSQSYCFLILMGYSPTAMSAF